MRGAPPAGGSGRSVATAARVAVIFAEVPAMAGWGLLAVFSGLFWCLGSYFDWRGLIPWGGPDASVEGIVDAVEETHSSEGGDEDAGTPGTPIFAVHYHFEVSGTAYRGTSYSLGRVTERGTRHLVEYEVGDPARSRIRGMRRARFQAWVGLLLLVFPAVGLALVVTATIRGIHAQALFSCGVLGEGSFTLVRAPPGPSSEPGWTALYQIGGQEYRVTLGNADLKPMDEAFRFPILYDPGTPGRFLGLAQLPCGIRVDDSAGVTCDRPGRAWSSLLFPALFLAANVAGFLFTR